MKLSFLSKKLTFHDKNLENSEPIHVPRVLCVLGIFFAVPSFEYIAFTENTVHAQNTGKNTMLFLVFLVILDYYIFKIIMNL